CITCEFQIHWHKLRIHDGSVSSLKLVTYASQPQHHHYCTRPEKNKTNHPATFIYFLGDSVQPTLSELKLHHLPLSTCVVSLK
uniref:Uncharacterized protein n=1 Tax=Dromaius novaehollandiae TaxID=8790 RepID=A0A8C4JPY8_DRONO